MKCKTHSRNLKLSRRGPIQGPDRGPIQGPDRGPIQGPGRGPIQGPDRVPIQGPDRGPIQGPGKNKTCTALINLKRTQKRETHSQKKANIIKKLDKIKIDLLLNVKNIKNVM